MADQNQKPKELSMETRMILAFILMGAVLFVTPYFFKQPPDSAKTATKDQKTAAKSTAQQPAATQNAPAAVPAPSATPPTAGATPGATPATLPAVAAAKEETLTIDTDLYRITLSNRGALVKSWVLKKYKDSAGKPLDLVSAEGVKKVGLPMSVSIKGRSGWAPVNDALYAVTPIEGGYEFVYSAGTTQAKRSIKTRPGSYLVEISSELTEAGVPVPHRLSWRGGFGDASIPAAAANKLAVWFNATDNKLVANKADFANDGPQTVSGNFAFAGFTDAYFAIVALQQGSGSLELTAVSDSVLGIDGKEAPVLGGSFGGEGRNRFTMFVGPKDYTMLGGVDKRLVGLIDFGWTKFLAEPLFRALEWTNDNYIRNWGWSIVLVTVVINILLLPLKISSLRSMRKMSLIQPQMNAINEKYKGLSLKDPKMQNKNAEIMELYKKEGVNPAGGCLPLLLQFPFLFAFYSVLSAAIELRQTPWLWIKDLSVMDPIYVLPVIMVASQFLMQKMTPATGGDPMQQKMMLFMPLVFGFMFMTQMAGLVLYWTTGNLVAIVQQLAFNRFMPAPAAPPPAVINVPKRKK